MLLQRVIKKYQKSNELEKFVLLIENTDKLRGRNAMASEIGFAFDYLWELSSKLSLVELEIDTAMLPDWEGSVEDFEKMVVAL